ncbi:MAG: sensor histidine kinase [Magnetovibrionaceae bacterium]
MIRHLRLWPKSLAGQFILLALAALVIAQLATVLVLFAERREALRTVAFNEVGGRLISTYHLLGRAGPDLEDFILESSSSRRIRFSNTPRPIERGDLNEMALFLAGRVAEGLSLSPDQVHVRFKAAKRFHKEDRGKGPRWGRFGSLEISVPHPHQFHVDQGSLPNTGETSPRWLTVSASAPPVKSLGGSFVFTSLGFGALGVIAVVVIMTRRITRPLGDLTAAATAFGQGRKTDPVPETGPRDVAAAAQAFNAMRDRIERFVADRNHLLAAVAHDLRTPITSLKLQAEFVEDEEAKARINRILDEMTELVEATLSLAREEAKAETSLPLDLASLIESLVEDFRALGARLQFEAEAAPVVTLLAKPVALKRMFRNLMENAARYASSARIDISLEPGFAVIEIADDGPGLPEDALERAFEPFVRMENSRSTETGGVGLGLAIARGIARAHGGDITLRNSPSGLTARVSLPIA